MRSTERASILVVLASIAATSLAHAQTEGGASAPDPRAIAARRALIEDAMRARVAGDHARALELGRRAVELQPSPTLRRFVAEELMVNRRWSEAVGMAELCENDFRSTPASRQRDEHVAACRAVRDEASRHTARMTVRFVGQAPEGARVLVNGAVVPAALVGVAMVVDEGRARVECAPPGYRAISRDVLVLAGASVDVPIELVRSERVDPTPGGRVGPVDPVDRTLPSRVVLQRPTRVIERQTTSPLVVVGSVVGGAGALAAVGLEVGAVLVAGAFDAQCFPRDVPQSGAVCGERYESDQRTIDVLQGAAIGGLGVAAVGGAIAIVGALRPTRERVTVLATGTGVVVGGSF